MEEKRKWFFENMQALEFSTYYMKNQNMMKEVQHLYYKMVAMLMGAYTNDDITEEEFWIFVDYLADVQNDLFRVI